MNLRTLAAEFGVSIAILKRLLPDLFTQDMTGSTHINDADVALARAAWNGREIGGTSFILVLDANAMTDNPQTERARVVAYCEEPIHRMMPQLIHDQNQRVIAQRIMQLVHNGLEMCFDAGQVHERSTVSPPMMSMIEALIGTAVGLKTAELMERIEALEAERDAK